MSRIVDLSQEIHPGMQLFPVFPQPAFIQWTNREIHGFQTEVMFMVTHTGTHVDAPFHFDSKGRKVHELKVDALLSTAVLLDFTSKREKELISAHDLKEAAKARGIDIRKGDIVICCTGWERYLGREEYLTAYPGLSKEAAVFLASKRIAALGIDTSNADHPDDATFPVHNTLLSKGILIIENLFNLKAIHQPRFRFIALPLKIRGGTGSPIRAIATLD